jgi:hypothetical protein
LIKKVRDKSGRKKQKAKNTLVILKQSSLFFKYGKYPKGIPAQGNLIHESIEKSFGKRETANGNRQ